MSLPSFRRSKGDASEPLTVEAAAAILAERQAHAATAQTELDTKRDAYNAVLAAAGPNLDTPEVERAGRELSRAIERHERAQAAAGIAESEHAAAVKRARRGTDAQWDEIERLTAARAKAAAKFTAAAVDLAAARDDFLRAAQKVHNAIPAAFQVGERCGALKSQAAAGQVRAELERVGVIPDPRRGLGFPAAKPLAEIGAELCTMVKRLRVEAANDPREPENRDSRTMVRPVPSPEAVDLDQGARHD